MRRIAYSVMALLASGTSAHAQQAGATDPGRLVGDALAGDHAVVRHTEHYHGAAHDWTVALNTAQSTCYEVIGFARGTSQVHLTVNVRRSRLGDPLALASSASEVARTRFCASLPGRVYSLAVHADGDADWAIAVHRAPADASSDVGAASRERLANALANSATQTSSAAPDAGAPHTAPAQNFPIGGTETDYVGGQLRGLVRGQNVRALVAAERVTLQENQWHQVALSLVAGHCIIAAASGVPSVSDLDLQITDPSGNRVAEETERRGTESIQYCPPYSGTYQFTVRAFAGFGLTGIQAFEVP